MTSDYAIGEAIGRGGMGEVMCAYDHRIGREVALKRLRATSPDKGDVLRFLREARIQARLEHPAIVPVYELSRPDADRPYFTMKRITGHSLAHAIAKATHTRPNLLRAFAEVCRAIDYAHSRNVIHRDLKPTNIMLGEFGEVYVIDWGVAQVIDDSLDVTAPVGKVFGTAGYMSP